MASYNVGVGINAGSSAVAVVEFLDDYTTLGKGRRVAVRDVIEVRAVERGLSDIGGIVDEVVKVAAPLGPEVRVVFSTTGSQSVIDVFSDAYSMSSELVRRPMPVTVTPADAALAMDEHQRWTIGNSELVIALQNAVKRRDFTIPPGEGVEALITEAMKVQPQEGTGERVRFAPHQPTARLIALALALYPWFAPSTIGRRYRTQGETYESFDEAHGRLGQAALN